MVRAGDLVIPDTIYHRMTIILLSRLLRARSYLLSRFGRRASPPGVIAVGTKRVETSGANELLHLSYRAEGDVESVRETPVKRDA